MLLRTRAVTPADRDSLIRLYTDAHRRWFKGIIPDNQLVDLQGATERAIAWSRSKSENSRVETRVATLNDKLVAFAAYRMDPFHQSVHLEAFCVDPDIRQVEPVFKGSRLVDDSWGRTVFLALHMDVRARWQSYGMDRASVWSTEPDVDPDFSALQNRGWSRSGAIAIQKVQGHEVAMAQLVFDVPEARLELGF